MSVRRHNLIALTMLVLVGTLVLSGCTPAVIAAPETVGKSPDRTITVVGQGEVMAKPDIATVNLGIEVTAPTVTAAVDEANVHMKAILAALKELGITEKDIQTSNFSINYERPAPAVSAAPSAKPGSGETSAGVYHVSNMVQVTIRDLDKVSDVLDAAVKAGANNVWGVSFGLDETNSLEAQAREKAVADARARAESLAKLNGVSVGDVISISEVIGGIPGSAYPVSSAVKGLGGGGAPVEPGELTFSTQIQIVYAIR